MSSLWITAGQVAMTNGQQAVIGNGTQFVSNGVQAGWIFTADYKTIYQVADVADDTHLTVTRIYGETSTPAGTYQNYAIIPNLSPLGTTLLANVQQLVTLYAQFPGGSPVQVLSAPPTAPSVSGSFAINETNGTLYLYLNGAWSLIAGTGGVGESSGQGAVLFTTLFAAGLQPGASGTADGVVVFAAGRTTETDGLGGMAVWENTAADPHDGVLIINPFDGISTRPGRWRCHLNGQMGGYAVAGLPPAALLPGLSVSMTDLGRIPAYSDGTHWRKFSDDTVIA